MIARHGYEKATIQAIAAQAGLAPGLIHYHFKNKQEILVSLIGTMAQAAARALPRRAGRRGRAGRSACARTSMRASAWATARRRTSWPPG